MTEVETLQFESGRSLQALYGNDLAHLKLVERELSVRLTTREGWLRVEGSAEQVLKVRRLFQQLERARGNGVPIRRQEFQYALRALQEPEVVGLDQLSATRLTVSSKRAPVTGTRPRPRQRHTLSARTRSVIQSLSRGGPASCRRTAAACR